MSGFFERLASGVLHGQRAIHPVVGTTWSPAAKTGTEMMEVPGAGDVMETSAEARVPPTPRRADARALTAAQPSTQPPMQPQREREQNTPLSNNAAHREVAQPAIAEAAVFEPLVASPRRSVVAAPPLEPQADANMRESEAAPRPQETSEQRAGLQQYRIESTRPLVPAARIPVPAMGGARKAPVSLPSSQRRAQAARPTVEQPDSIEIHIGRIEVLAAQPRPAKAAALPAKKSLDLGDYLRRERRPQ